MEATETPPAHVQVSDGSMSNRLGRTVVLLTLLGIMLVTGLWKALWLNHALTHYPVLDRGMDDPSAGRVFLLLGLAGPVVVLVIALLVSRLSRSPIERLRLIGKVGCLVVVLPWLGLFVSGVSA
jgi:hypothetical protein